MQEFSLTYTDVFFMYTVVGLLFFLIPEDDKRQEKGCKVPF